MQDDRIEALFAQASRHHDAGRLAEAIAGYDRVLSIDPLRPEALDARGIAHAQGGDFARALANFDRAVLADPRNAGFHTNRAIALVALDRADEALAAYRHATGIDPRNAAIWYNLGALLKRLNRAEEALIAYDRAVALDPHNPEISNNRGIIFEDLHKTAEALACFERAITLDPRHAAAWSNRANALRALGRIADALASHDRAIALDPDSAALHLNKAISLKTIGRYADAAAGFAAALAIDPMLPNAAGFRLHCALQLCDWRDFVPAVAAIERAIDAGHGAASPFVHLTVSGDAARNRRAATLFVCDTYPANPILGPIAPRSSQDRVRIGYFSADFHDHATMQLMAEVFESHDRSRFELFAFSFGPDRDDAARRRAVRAFDHFFDVRAQPDHAIARLARTQRIDIAIDLKGFTEDARPGIFAARAAPVQIGYLGYPGTSGAPYIDYLIADPILIPDSHFDFYSEKIVRLPGSYQANCRTIAAAAALPSRTAPGLPDDAFVYCCFNQNYKITPDIYVIWMEILTHVSHAVLWLWVDSSIARANLRAAAERAGIDPARLVFADRVPLPEHLARLPMADLFLDTAPCNAHTTASDALRMGLPLLTLAGQSFAGRVAASLLTAVGLPELIVKTPEDYRDTAIRWGLDPSLARQARDKLRVGSANGALFDPVRLTRQLEQAYAIVHARHRDGAHADHIDI